MKNSIISSLLFIVYLCFFYPLTALQANEFSLSRQYQSIMDSFANNNPQEALAELNDVISKNPEERHALELRRQAFLMLGDVNNALKDNDSILKNEPTDSGLLLYKCILNESQTKKKSEALLCYANSAKILEQALPNEELAQDGGYVRILILAEDVKAQLVLQKYCEWLNRKIDMAEFQFKQESDMAEFELIKEFDRDKIKPVIDAIHNAQYRDKPIQ